ncbi:MarR family winged helix-turn-helix transcriptional regulator [Arcobacter sp. LA11]|uniref:MarR family winged helix-turn-helix transcriptional regulator n=1 Tax=Arcobacter sp. LA11 TaxID=1898176 RepID=UPI0009FAE2CC|nr:MarR family transcriptional regulator [Arcobacter sp. LA11]
MNREQFETNLKNVKKFTPEVYKNTMKITTPFFVLHKKLFDKGDELLINDFSINQTELDILSSLYYMTDGTFTMSPTKLYEVMLFSSGGMTKVLKKLEDKKLIKRINNEQDKRSKLVQLTQKGKETTSNSLKEVVGFENEYLSKLNEKEQELFKNLLYKILKE